ncbi:MAG TPA: CusA/CzcA family heavy metal efflux RND transporter [Tepidisphaeraceae bacterium]|nr:CusA/CzcA family heavy metal efflux RND transporter [Tepidisphaeraceae bacterium]
MLTRFLAIVMLHRLLVLSLMAGSIALGVWCFTQQKIDAYPDISAQMVELVTMYPGRAPEEVERQVTIPIELAMGNVPKVETIRSRTIFGLSVVDMEFEEGTEGYWARQRVSEALPNINLPAGITPQMQPYTTAYGEIYRYQIKSDGTHDLMELRTLNDWVIIRRLLRTPGVGDTANFGGFVKQYQVTLNPRKLEQYGIALGDVVNAVSSNNSASGGSVVRRGAESFVIRGVGTLADETDISHVFIKSVDGTPIYVRDVASVGLGYPQPSGIWAKDRNNESVEGIVVLRKGENPSETLKNIEAAVQDLNENVLPKGVRIVPYYNRETLITNTLETVSHSVLIGITLVILVLLFFLGSPKMALLVALTIPFALLFAIILMYFTSIPIGLLSIGAIDFGIIVDAAVIIADQIAHRLGQVRGRLSRRAIRDAVLNAVDEVEHAVLFAMLIIIATYLPLLTLTQIEGLLFRPMAITLVFALLGALIFAMIAVPVLATLLFRNGMLDWENPLLRRFRPIYRQIVEFLLRWRWPVAAGALCLVTFIFLRIIPEIGTEFLPYMDEGVIWLRANMPDGMSLEQNAQYGNQIRDLILRFPDVQFAMTQAGRNDDGTDPFPPSREEYMIGPRPRAQWVQFKTKQELINAIGAKLRAQFPTVRLNFTQPIIDSVTEDTNGTSANLAIDYSGPDSAVLLDLCRQTVQRLRRIRGAVDANLEQEGPSTQLVITPNRALCARYNIKMDDVNTLINTALGGSPVTTLYEGERQFNVVVKFAQSYVNSADAIGRLPVFTADGISVPLSQVAKIELKDGQTLIARENDKRRMTVRCDIVGRDQGGFVREAQDVMAREVPLPAGYNVAWLGMFENLTRARHHFAALVPITLLIVYVILSAAFGSQRAVFVVFLAVPFALVGGFLALYFRGMHLNVSTGVGFASLFGVAIMDGVVMIRRITQLRIDGMEIDDAILEGTQQRLRPILMASTVAILGLLPASLATGIGSDVQRPLATVIVWGLVSASILTLFVVPVMYRILAPHVHRPREEGQLTLTLGSQAEPAAGGLQRSLALVSLDGAVVDAIHVDAHRGGQLGDSEFIAPYTTLDDGIHHSGDGDPSAAAATHHPFRSPSDD